MDVQKQIQALSRSSQSSPFALRRTRYKILLYILLCIFSLQPSYLKLYAQTDTITQDVPKPIDASTTTDLSPAEQAEIDKLTAELENMSPEDLSLTINFPVIGKVTLYPEKDDKGNSIMRAVLKQPSQTINLSPIPIKFDTFEIVMRDGKNTSVSSQVTAFGKKAKLELVKLKQAAALKEEVESAPEKAAPEAATKDKEKKGKKFDLDITSAHFRITFIEKPTIEILPDKSVTLNYTDLILRKDKPNTVGSNINMFGDNVEIKFTYSKDKVELKGSLESGKLGALVPDLKNSKYADVLLKKLTITTTQKTSAKGEFATDTKDIESKLEGEADFSSLKTKDVTLKLDDLQITANLSKQNGFHLETNLTNLQLPYLGTVNNAKFIFDSADSVKTKQTKEEKAKTPNPEAQASITGDGSFKIPNLGTLNYTLTAKYISDAFEFDGKIKQDTIDYSGIEFKEVNLNVNTKTNTLNLNGIIAGIKNDPVQNTVVEDLDINGILIISKNPKIASGFDVQFKGSVKKSKWQPFASTTLPPFIKNITFTDLKVELVKSLTDILVGELVFSGTTTVLDESVEATFKFISTDIAKGMLIRGKLSSIPKQLKKLDIKDTEFIIPTIQYQDPITKIRFNAGFNMIIGVALSGYLEPVGKLLGKSGQVINIYGNYDPENAKKTKLGLELSEGVPLKTKAVSIGPVQLQVTGEPAFSLILNMTVKPSSKDSPLNFRGEAGFSATSVLIKAMMAGLWKDPFGIKGFSVGNLDLGLEINFELLETAHIPKSVELAGEIDLSSDKKVIVAGKFDTDFTDFAILGSYQGELTLLDIVNLFATKMGAKIPTKSIPHIGIKDVEVRMAPKAVQVGPILIMKGTTIKGEIDILKEKAAVDFNIDVSGVTAKADMSKITLGPLIISAGKQADGKIRQTKFGGPEIDIELTLEKQIFLVSGMLDLSGIFQESADISISSDGIQFAFDANIGPDKMFDASVVGKSSGAITDPDFKLTIDMKQKFTEYIQKAATDAINKVENEIKEKMEAAIKKVNSINDRIASDQKAIDDAEKAVKSAKDKIDSINSAIATSDKKIDEATQKVKSAKNAVDSINKKIKEAQGSIDGAQKKVDSIQSEINHKKQVISNLESEIKHAAWYKKAYYGVKDGAQIAVIGTELGGLYTALGVATGALQAAKGIATGALIASRETANGALKVAEGFLDEVVKNVGRGTLIAARETSKGALTVAEQFLDKVVKNVDLGALVAARESAQGILKAAEGTGVGVMEAGKFVVKSLTQGFMINEIKFDGSLKSIEHGKLPDLLFVMHIVGQEVKINLNFDFTNLSKSVEDVANNIAQKIKKIFKI